MNRKICLCIHGHFYQPPRENAWLEAIETQNSAYPFHDWNERIHHECYLPNTRARLFDEKLHIINIVNNFQALSFNIGPTLMSWLAKFHPATYGAIIEADQKSCLHHHGHGNAIAQGYNHMILPLANTRDKITQVRWALADFREHYKREAEGIWLPETACNDDTLRVLIDEGVRFTILEPHQAQEVRHYHSDHWEDVSSGNIDPKRPYRYFHPEDRSRHIDIFFYDGPISKAVAFESLLHDAELFMNRIEGAVVDYGDSPQLLHLATDGESYGHHTTFGERALAYLLYTEAEKRNYRIVNYGEFLEENPPVYEVRIKYGENGEGTSWSCSHGVGRWKTNCGCRGDGPAEWTQHWRQPLRDALDWLRDELMVFFEEKGENYFKNVWRARDAYIDLMLDRSEASVNKFMSNHTLGTLTPEEITYCLNLLEIQRHAMLMYTSCGWFFTEISGLETVQVLQYAARAIQLAEDMSSERFDEQFREKLSYAPSNVGFLGNGKALYDQSVKPAVATLKHIVTYYVMGEMLEDSYFKKEDVKLYCFQLTAKNIRKEKIGDLRVNLGRIKIKSEIDLEEADFIFIVMQVGVFDFHCSLMPFTNQDEFEKIEESIFDSEEENHLVKILEKANRYFGPEHMSLKDLLAEDRMKIIQRLSQGQVDELNGFYEKVYDENVRLSDAYRSAELPIPGDFKYIAERVLTERFFKAVKQLENDGFAVQKIGLAYRILATSMDFKIQMKMDRVKRYLTAELNDRIRQLNTRMSPTLVRECINLDKIAKKFKLRLDIRNAQTELFDLIQCWSKPMHRFPEVMKEHSYLLVQLAERLQISTVELQQNAKEKNGVTH